MSLHDRNIPGTKIMKPDGLSLKNISLVSIVGPMRSPLCSWAHARIIFIAS